MVILKQAQGERQPVIDRRGSKPRKVAEVENKRVVKCQGKLRGNGSCKWGVRSLSVSGISSPFALCYLVVVVVVVVAEGIWPVVLTFAISLRICLLSSK